ncbi:MAG: hypothetical protein KDA79_09270 [Planctomycetaceae bacterium]|nr:hypothetical protein [Planctomycetaceae bacterium]
MGDAIHNSTGLNVLCVKWGDKYHADDVNRLQAMIAEHLTLPHRFYCYTDDPEGVRADIIPIAVDNRLTVWWNKLALFQRGFGGLEGRMLFLDLDVVVQRNIDDLVWYHPQGLTCVEAFWKGPQAINTVNYNMNINSSVMTWNAGECGAIWNHFAAHETEMLERYIGMDRFLFHEGFELRHWPRGWIYSRLNGIDLRPFYYSYRKHLHCEVFSFPETRICLLNGVWTMPPEKEREFRPKRGLQHHR